MVTDVAENVYWKNQKLGDGPTEAKLVVPIKVVLVEFSWPPNANAYPGTVSRQSTHSASQQDTYMSNTKIKSIRSLKKKVLDFCSLFF